MTAAETGYSGTPLARKLGIRRDTRVALIHAPDHAERLLSPIPDGVRIRCMARGPVEVAAIDETWSALRFVVRRQDR